MAKGNKIEKEISMDKMNRRAKVGMILGLVSIVGWFIPLFGYPLTILAIIFGSLGIKSEKKKMALAGIILGGVFFLVTLANSILSVVYFS